MDFLPNKQNDMYKDLNRTGIKLGIVLIISYFLFNLIPVLLLNYIFSSQADENYYVIYRLSKIITSVTANIFPFLFLKQELYDKEKHNLGVRNNIYLVFVFLTFVFTANYFSSVFVNILGIFGLSIPTSTSVYCSNIYEYMLLIISSAVVPAICEEFAFRRCLLNSLRKFGDSTAITVSAVCFGFLHNGLNLIPFSIMCGFVLGYIYVYTGSYLKVVILHMLNNLISVFFSILFELVDETTYNNISDTAVIIITVIGIVCFIKLSKNKKDFLNIKGFEGNISFSERLLKVFVNIPMGFVLLLGIDSVLSWIRNIL